MRKRVDFEGTGAGFFDTRVQLRPDPAVFPVPGQHLEALRGSQAMGDQPEQMLSWTGAGQVEADRPGVPSQYRSDLEEFQPDRATLGSS